ncbi:MAG: hypothetical protein BWZ08_02324 [candidate division BRC1 bacterium ADurb.BinA292]|nr:MAG: hypothetical protein BWZ08_02324 [candidate division BRC1 bacterium ADurb.BinA292]
MNRTTLGVLLLMVGTLGQLRTFLPGGRGSQVVEAHIP